MTDPVDVAYATQSSPAGATAIIVVCAPGVEAPQGVRLGIHHHRRNRRRPGAEANDAGEGVRSHAQQPPELKLGTYDGTTVARSFLTFDMTQMGRSRTIASQYHPVKRVVDRMGQPATKNILHFHALRIVRATGSLSRSASKGVTAKEVARSNGE